MDVDTCEPLIDAYVDIWNCNATGICAGVVGNGNGDASDKSNYDTTFLRGVHKTNEDGVIRFEALCPGYYDHRATHIHGMFLNPSGDPFRNNLHTIPITLLSHTMNINHLQENNTLFGLNEAHDSHITSILLDGNIKIEVYKTWPYTADDIFVSEIVAAGEVPIWNTSIWAIVSLDELLAWITLGINSTENQPVDPVMYDTGDGVVNPNRYNKSFTN